MDQMLKGNGSCLRGFHTQNDVLTILQPLLSQCELMGKSLFVLQGVRDAVVTQFSRYKNWLQTPNHFLEAGCSPTNLDDVAMEAEQEVQGDLLS